MSGGSHSACSWERNDASRGEGQDPGGGFRNGARWSGRGGKDVDTNNSLGVGASGGILCREWTVVKRDDKKGACQLTLFMFFYIQSVVWPDIILLSVDNNSNTTKYVHWKQKGYLWFCQLTSEDLIIFFHSFLSIDHSFNFVKWQVQICYLYQLTNGK